MRRIAWGLSERGARARGAQAPLLKKGDRFFEALYDVAGALDRRDAVDALAGLEVVAVAAPVERRVLELPHAPQRVEHAHVVLGLGVPEHALGEPAGLGADAIDVWRTD